MNASPPSEITCSYKSRKCSHPRAVKRNGKMHTLCEFHRARQNEHQRKSDRKHKDTKLARQSLKQCDADMLSMASPLMARMQERQRQNMESLLLSPAQAMQMALPPPMLEEPTCHFAHQTEV
ncbi:hypothetical protein THRCLA_20277 [Thraustotheca clavata]|uniref:Uncharacterized protein n=1 Tax=Thraustotheca clavata TaxID=74557 RepID=A0A1W0A970_9STRA|nr:hypothetical protein THRCLA_20277 [Thraustotheca clavata]